MPYEFVCPVCKKGMSKYPTESVTICDMCGESIVGRTPRLILVGSSGYRTFCSPECLQRYQELDELFSKKGTIRES